MPPAPGGQHEFAFQVGQLEAGLWLAGDDGLRVAGVELGESDEVVAAAVVHRRHPEAAEHRLCAAVGQTAENAGPVIGGVSAELEALVGEVAVVCRDVLGQVVGPVGRRGYVIAGHVLCSSDGRPFAVCQVQSSQHACRGARRWAMPPSVHHRRRFCIRPSSSGRPGPDRRAETRARKHR